MMLTILTQIVVQINLRYLYPYKMYCKCTPRYSWQLAEDPKFDFNSSLRKPIIRTNKIRSPAPFKLQVGMVFARLKTFLSTQVHTGVRSFLLPRSFVTFLLRHPVNASIILSPVFTELSTNIHQHLHHLE